MFLVAITQPGLAYRRWVWDFTEPGRFRGDISRNFTFGVQAIEGGFLNLYENQVRDNPSRDKKIDYPPLRLATFEAWAAWNRRAEPGVQKWRDDYAFSAPLMRYYAALQWAAALAALLIVRHWLRRCAAGGADEDAGPLADGSLRFREALTPWTGLWRSLLAFTILWFDPGVAIIAHGWPSPNMWVIPFYLWTCLFCLWNRWFTAGLVMSVGAMVQGQQMFIAPIFVLWPLLAGRPTLGGRWVAGFALGFMTIAGGWMLTLRPDLQLPDRLINWPALLWITSTLALLTFIGLHDRVRWWRQRRAWWWVPVGVTGAVIMAPSIGTRDGLTIGLTLVVVLLLLAAFWKTAWVTKRYLLALVAAGCLLACVPFFGASTAWWKIGFLYGAERFPEVGGKLTNNLGAILFFNFDWRNVHDTCFTLAPDWLLGWPAEPLAFTNRQVLLAVFLPFFFAGAIALALQWRRRGVGLLVALVLPWALFYTLMPQMSPRYAVFTAGVGAICAGHSIGLSLMILLVFSALTVEQTALCMMWGNRINANSAPNLLFNVEMGTLFDRINPGPSWAVLLATGVLLWVSFVGLSRRRGQRERATGHDSHASSRG